MLGVEEFLADEGEQVEGGHVLGLALESALLEEEAEKLESLEADCLVVAVEEFHDGADA